MAAMIDANPKQGVLQSVCGQRPDWPVILTRSSAEDSSGELTGQPIITRKTSSDGTLWKSVAQRKFGQTDWQQEEKGGR